MSSLVFLIATMILIMLSWVYVAYCYIRKRKLSNAYGVLAISYIIHAISLHILEMSNGFYIGFSIIWIIFHLIYGKIEKIK